VVLFTALSIFSGACWTLVYIDMINRGFRDETYGMPLFALAFNISWEFIFSFLIRYGEGINFQEVINATWFFLDAVIVYTYFRYGREHFPDPISKRWFIPWSLVVFAASFITIYFAGLEFPGLWGALYSAFAQNLMMSVLFIGMLVQRNDVDGQSMYIAIFKWLGSVAPAIAYFTYTGSNLVLAFGIGIFIFDVIYIVMLHHKFRELSLNPFTREPIAPKHRDS
jgi:hypothetical protein